LIPLRFVKNDSCKVSIVTANISKQMKKAVSPSYISKMRINMPETGIVKKNYLGVLYQSNWEFFELRRLSSFFCGCSGAAKKRNRKIT
jgi:hypothetical protein